MTPASVINNLFTQKVSSVDGREKLAAAGGTYIRDRLREVSFIDKIIPVQNVTPAECQVSVNHDTFVMIIEVEPQSRGMVLTFRGQPTARLIRAPRAEVPFFTISSEKYEKNEQELMAYRMAITKIIEDNSVKDLQEVKDREGLRHIESCVQALQKEANSGSYTALKASTYASTVKYSVIKGQSAQAAATDDFTIYPVLKPDFVELLNLIDSRRLKTDRILITEPDWNNIMSWTLSDLGDKMASEIVVDGYKYNTVLGKKYIRTIKTDILRRGNIYSFTEPEFFGVNYVLNNVKFFIDKKANWISFQSWMDVGMGFINVASCAKLELYSGSVTPTATDTGYAAAQPVAETALGAVNNRVDQGFKFPSISQF